MQKTKETKENYFEKLSKLEGKVEKKNNLNYISWADAWALLKKQHSEANYRITQNENGMPYFSDKTGGFVKVAVSVGNVSDKSFIEHSVMLPIMDYKNDSMKDEDYSFEGSKWEHGKKVKATIEVKKYTAFDINKAIQRALTKAIAMHGIGLYVYQGEDFPENPDSKTFPGKQKANNPDPKPMTTEKYTCTSCGMDISQKVNDFSVNKYSQALCMNCQKKADNKVDEQEESLAE